jgi:hypothetical protein
MPLLIHVFGNNQRERERGFGNNQILWIQVCDTEIPLMNSQVFCQHILPNNIRSDFFWIAEMVDDHLAYCNAGAASALVY